MGSCSSLLAPASVGGWVVLMMMMMMKLRGELYASQTTPGTAGCQERLDHV